MPPTFTSPAEFREVIDRIFSLMRDDPEMGPKLRAADMPQRFEFTDVDLVVNLRGGEDDSHSLVWEWTDDIAWEPKLRMAMTTDVANRYFQGKENIAMAIARRRIKAAGDVRSALVLFPILKPLHRSYREMVASEYPHLEV